MNLERDILLDLVNGQATTSSIAENLGIHADVALTFLRSLYGAGLVEPIAIGPLTAWRLTDKARQLHADSLEK